MILLTSLVVNNNPNSNYKNRDNNTIKNVIINDKNVTKY